ncbi:MAG: hypothetical protein Q9225_000575 [Loekoesia sp. 1 TL-2023]
MTFPPERITVKRRRDEEPVDALCDEIHSQTPSAVKDQPQVPLVKTTRPEEDAAPWPSASPAPLQSNVVGDTTGSANGQAQDPKTLVDPLSSTQGRSQIRIPKEPRRFHFTRTSTSTRNSSVMHGGIQKVKKKQKKTLAVFVERADDVQNSGHRRANSETSHEEQAKSRDDSHTPPAESSSPRKRPLASPAERNWRDQTWKQPLRSNSETKPAVAGTLAKDTTSDSVKLARQLQQFALDVSGNGTGAPRMHKHPYAKVKPKPPKPRPAKADAGVIEGSSNIPRDAMDLSGNTEDPENFVFDVYLRQAEHIDENTSTGLHSALVRTDPDKVGVLVIEDEDQETWELYGNDDQSSDEDWNSEEEDENAEDYYGNDYPEDELDSDDEYDRDTYKHWHSAFDEEDFEENIDWSDDEPAAKKPWRYH